MGLPNDMNELMNVFIQYYNRIGCERISHFPSECIMASAMGCPTMASEAAAETRKGKCMYLLPPDPDSVKITGPSLWAGDSGMRVYENGSGIDNNISLEQRYFPNTQFMHLDGEPLLGFVKNCAPS